MYRTSGLVARLTLLSAVGAAGIWSSTAVGAPVITGASGSVTQNSTLTVSGSGFGAKSPAMPYLWAPMQGSSQPSSLGIVTSWTSLSQLTYADGCGAGGGGCLVGKPSDGIATNAWGAAITSPAGSDWNAYGRRTYIYRKSKKTFAYDSSKNVKIIRTWGSSPTQFLQYPDFYFGTSNGRIGVEGIPQLGTHDYTMDAVSRQKAIGPVGQWYTEEISLKSNSSANVADADFRLAVNGGPDLVSFPNTQWELNTITLKTASGYSNDGRMTILYPVHMIVEGSDGWVPTVTGSQYWADDVYVDNTWARVIIADAPVFSHSTDREIQIPLQWADGSIQVNVNIKAFPTGKQMYLFVVDQNGVPSAGYPLTPSLGSRPTSAPRPNRRPT